MNGRRCEWLLSLSSRLNAASELPGALRAVCEEAALALGAPVVTLDLFDERSGRYYPAAASGLQPPQRALLQVRLQSYAAAGAPRVRRTAEPAGPPYSLDAAGQELYDGIGARLLARVRIERSGRPLGSLNVFGRAPEQAFGPDEHELLQVMAGMSAEAIDHLRLAALAARRLEFTQALQAMDLAITTNLDIHVMLQVCLQHITACLEVDAADVRLLNANTLQFAVGRGLRANVWQKAAPRLGEGPAGRAALEGRLVSALDLQREVQARLLPIAEGFASALAVPLIVRGHTLGVLEVFNRLPLDPDVEWLECLQAQARVVAIGVHQSGLYEGLERTRLDLTLSYDETIECWLRALQLHDGILPAQSKHLAELSVTLAQAAGVASDDLLHVRRGALLHDVGLLCLPEGLLRKPGPLSSSELTTMRRHPELARELLSPSAHFRRALEIPECHHEKWDGSGYPHGLAGELIPLAARAFAVLDVWEALRAPRPHRPAWSDARAFSHIVSESGLHFDPRVVDVFRDLLAAGRLAPP